MATTAAPVEAVTASRASWIALLLATVIADASVERTRLLTEWGYRSICVQLSRRGYRGGEPNGIPRESSQLHAKVFKGLRDDGIKAADIAKELGIATDELRSHLFELTLTFIPATRLKSVEGGDDPA